jgi:hypothetical protein
MAISRQFPEHWRIGALAQEAVHFVRFFVVTQT